MVPTNGMGYAYILLTKYTGYGFIKKKKNPRQIAETVGKLKLKLLFEQNNGTHKLIIFMFTGF